MELTSITLRSSRAIAPHCNARLAALPGRYFRLSQLSIPHEVAGKLLVTDLAVAGNSQMMSPASVPALLFSDQAVVESFIMDPAMEGDEVTVALTNAADHPVVAEVTLRGYVESEVLASMGRRFMGLGSTLVYPGMRSNIHVQPCSLFRGERLVIPSNIAEDFRIIDVSVGSFSQLNSPGSLPASVFTEKVPQAESRGLALDTCDRSMFVTVAADNVSNVPRYFTGALVGWG
jgi:hypothetical protein